MKKVLFLLLLAASFSEHARAQSDGSLETATAENPYINSLGMRFVPLPSAGSEKILFSVWPTRIQDYTTFCKETGRTYQKWNWAPAPLPAMPGMPVASGGGTVYEEDPNYPVIAVSWLDAMAFCEWLTLKERGEGRLPANAEVRLPTDAEWSLAAGFSEPAGALPREKNGAAPGYAWGTEWPPPADAANLSGSEDKFPHLAPVGSFPANRLGIYDMAGNVEQWCLDLYDPARGPQRVGRGSAWASSSADMVKLSKRVQLVPGSRGNLRGFRCVIAVTPTGTTPNTLVVQEKLETPQVSGIILARVRGQKMRQEVISATGDSTALYDLETRQVTALDAGGKTAKVSSIDAEVRKSGLLSEAFRKDRPWTRPVSTGRKEKIGNWNTEIYTSEWSGAKATMWVTTEVPDWERKRTTLETIAKSLSPLGFDANSLALPGLAVKVNLAAGKEQVTFTVLTLYSAETPESLFVVPAGYQLLAESEKPKPAATAAPVAPVSRPAVGSVPSPTPARLNPEEFEISSIIVGAPSIAIVNGRDYEVGQTIAGKRSGVVAKLLKIREGSVVLSSPGGSVEIPLTAKAAPQRPKLPKLPPKK